MPGNPTQNEQPERPPITSSTGAVFAGTGALVRLLAKQAAREWLGEHPEPPSSEEPKENRRV